MRPEQVAVLVLFLVQVISVVTAAWVYLYITWRKRNRRQNNPRVDEEQQQEYRSGYGSSQENYIYSDNGYSWIFPPQPGTETIQEAAAATTTTASTQTENQDDNYEDPYTPPPPSTSATPQVVTTNSLANNPLALRPCPFCKQPHNWKISGCDPKTTGVARWIKINKNDSKLTML